MCTDFFMLLSEFKTTVGEFQTSVVLDLIGAQVCLLLEPCPFEWWWTLSTTINGKLSVIKNLMVK